MYQRARQRELGTYLGITRRQLPLQSVPPLGEMRKEATGLI